MNTVTVAHTIQQQIGTMTLMRIGARGFTARPDSLTFNFTYTTKGGARRVTFARVLLTGRDDYTVEISKTKMIAGTRVVTEALATTEGIYADGLAEHLEVQAGEVGDGRRPYWERS